MRNIVDPQDQQVESMHAMRDPEYLDHLDRILVPQLELIVGRIAHHSNCLNHKLDPKLVSMIDEMQQLLDYAAFARTLDWSSLLSRPVM